MAPASDPHAHCRGIGKPCPPPSRVADVLELVLHRGIVIDADARPALVGIQIPTIDARIIIASVDTYLRFAEAINRLDVSPVQDPVGLPGLISDLSGCEPSRVTQRRIRSDIRG
jgi:hypothetical protein